MSGSGKSTNKALHGTLAGSKMLLYWEINMKEKAQDVRLGKMTDNLRRGKIVPHNIKGFFSLPSSITVFLKMKIKTDKQRAFLFVKARFTIDSKEDIYYSNKEQGDTYKDGDNSLRHAEKLTSFDWSSSKQAKQQWEKNKNKKPTLEFRRKNPKLSSLAVTSSICWLA